MREIVFWTVASRSSQMGSCWVTATRTVAGEVEVMVVDVFRSDRNDGRAQVSGCCPGLTKV